MSHSIVSFRARLLLTAALLCSSVAGAQTDPAFNTNRQKQATVAGSGAQDFETLIKQDVASGRLTAEQGDSLIARYELADARVNDSMNKAVGNVINDVSLMTSSDQSQIAIAQMQNSAGSNGQVQLGGTAEQINEQANAVYTAQLQLVRLGIAANQTVQPVVQETLDEINGIVAQRAALISANPNVSAAEKFYVQQEANKVQLAAESSVNTAINTNIAKMQAAVDYYENNKAQILAQYGATIEMMVNKYGPNPADWPKLPEPVIGGIPPASSTPAGQDPGITTAADSPPQSKPYVTPTKGTIPGAGAQSDDAFNATRDQFGNGGINEAANATAAMMARPGSNASEQSAPLPNGIPSGVAAAAGAAEKMLADVPPGPASPPPPAQPPPLPPELQKAEADLRFPAGNLLVEGEILGNNGLNYGPLPVLPTFDDILSFEYGDAIAVAALQPIYAGYRLSDNTGDAMMSLNLQVPVPSAVMTVPSMQVTGMPSAVMLSLDLQPALCGR